MSGIDVALLFYSATVGGLFGAVIVCVALRRNHNDVMRLLQHYWSNDICQLKIMIDNKLSTKSVDN